MSDSPAFSRTSASGVSGPRTTRPCAEDESQQAAALRSRLKTDFRPTQDAASPAVTVRESVVAAAAAAA